MAWWWWIPIRAPSMSIQMVCHRVYCIQLCSILSMKHKEWNFVVGTNQPVSDMTRMHRICTTFIDIYCFYCFSFLVSFLFSRSIIFGHSTKGPSIPSTTEQLIESTAATNFDHTSSNLNSFFSRVKRESDKVDVFANDRANCMDVNIWCQFYFRIVVDLLAVLLYWCSCCAIACVRSCYCNIGIEI